MKKFLTSRLPLILSTVTLLIVTVFLRYNLYISSYQLSKEFQTQNAHELYSIDVLKISSRLHSFSSAINWVCIYGGVNGNAFLNMKRGNCNSGLLQQKVEITIPEADNLKIIFTLKFSNEMQRLFGLFLLMQLMLITSIVYATKKSEGEKRKKELDLYELSRKTFHDIRSPLATLNSIADAMKLEKNNDYLLFQKSIIRINEIANNLLSKTKMELKIDIPLGYSIVPFIEEIINEKIIEYKDLNLKITLKSESIINAIVIPMEFKSIISNLINNSIEACRHKTPEIQINVFQNEKIVHLKLSDNGLGIPPKLLSTLGLEEISTKSKGNGLGLKQAYTTLTEWNGAIEVLETSSSGTIFLISLQSDFKKIDELNSVVILIDDDELVRATWESKAKKKGVSFHSFEGIQSFKNSLSKFNYNSEIYIDSELGESKGEDFASELHALGFQNISITSGHPTEKFEKFTFLKSIITKKSPF